MKKYQIIYADPPWKYNTSQHNGAGGTSTGGAHTHYQVMEDIEICKLPIKDLADKNCLLFMWATGPKLDIAFDVGKSWGFKYCTIGFIWDKKRDNPGAYTMSRCELVLIFKKGKIPLPRGSRNIKQLVSIHRDKHSSKPPQVRKAIVELCGDKPRIELFTRKPHKLFEDESFDGWDVWGNEVKSDIEL